MKIVRLITPLPCARWIQSGATCDIDATVAEAYPNDAEMDRSWMIVPICYKCSQRMDATPGILDEYERTRGR